MFRNICSRSVNISFTRWSSYRQLSFFQKVQSQTCANKVQKFRLNCSKIVSKYSLKSSLQTLKSKFSVQTLKGKDIIFNVTIGSLCVSGYSVWAFSNFRTVHCHAKNKKWGTRLVEAEKAGEDNAKFDWKEFFRLIKPDIWYLLAAVVCAFAGAIVNIQIPLMLGDIVNVITTFAKDTTKNFLEEIKLPALKLIGFYGIQGLLTFSCISLISTVGENLSMKMRIKLFDALLRQDVEFFDKHKTGELVDRLTSDVQDFKSSFKLCLSQGLRASTQTVGCVWTLFAISPKLTGIMMTVIPSIIVVGTLMGSGLRTLSKKSQAQASKATAVADEALSNVRTVRAFAMEAKENELFLGEVEKSRVLSVRLGIGIGIFQGMANIALNESPSGEIRRTVVFLFIHPSICLPVCHV